MILTAIERLLEIKSYKHIHISFFGGEPLLEYKLMMIFLENIKEISNKYNMSYSASVTTNGYLLTKKRVESLCKYNCNYYQITIDGMDYTHNKTRMKKDGGKTWDIIMQNIYNCLELDLNFKILLRTNYNYEVIDSIIEFYEYIHNKFDDERIEIYYENIKDHGNEDTPELVSTSEATIVNIELAKIMKKYRLVCNNTSNRLDHVV